MNISQITKDPSKVGLFNCDEAAAVGSPISSLISQLSASLKRPGRRTLVLIDKALAWLRPFESPRAKTASASERNELLTLIVSCRQYLHPYMDVDRAEANLRMKYGGEIS